MTKSEQLKYKRRMKKLVRARRWTIINYTTMQAAWVTSFKEIR